MACDMCGKNASTRPALVEGVELQVCSQCAKFGKPVEKKQVVKKQPRRFEEPQETLVPDYSARIKRARESRGLTQRSLAIQLAQKESVIHNIESGSLIPSIDLAKKIEKHLGIVLLEIVKPVVLEKEKTDKTSSQGLTIGDVLKEKLGKL
ncbi:TIGR00270 family protein [Candidatus Woesearchaeota archaeon]|nr:MAG: TIGR00270 family protein [Candidatus Woesearchaeota archaeon]